MALPNPSLDDKTFAQIVEDARALIPRFAPDWTDHNVHDPGITFIELFAWLAEIQQYRLNRIAEFSTVRFLRLAGIVRQPLQPAVVTIRVAADPGLPKGTLVPSHSPVIASAREQYPFETLHDTYLTVTKLERVRTTVGGREVDQTQANENPAAHFAAFGPAPAPGDSLRLGFAPWFAEPEIHLDVELYEQGLPDRTALSADARAFVPSAALRWEYLARDGWKQMVVLEDGSLAFSRSGRIRFQTPRELAAEDEDLFWIRAALESGEYEIAPNIAQVSTNSVVLRQAERIVNEDLGTGAGTPDHVVRLRKAPILLNEEISAEPFQAGEVLSWRTMIMRLARPDDLHPPELAALVKRVAEMLGRDARKVFCSKKLNDRAHEHFQEPSDTAKRILAQAFDALLDNEELYDRRLFSELPLPPEFQGIAARYDGACLGKRQLRRFNRALLQAIFADQMVSDRLVIQVGTAAENEEEEPKTWTIWERRDDLSQSGPEDRHYLVNPETGEIRFGNGVNGKVPQSGELIRARLYFHSRGPEGNLAAGQVWRFLSPDAALRARGRNLTAASGGAAEEALDDAELRARREFRQTTRAVTGEDYTELAKQTPGLRVAQVRVLPQFNPKLPCIPMPGHVTVVVLPYSPEESVRPPRPSRGFLATIENHLNAARLVTTNLHVVAPAFVSVELSCRVFLVKGARVSEARARLERRVSRFLDPVRGGPDEKGWPFGRAVFPSEIHALLAGDEAVEYVTEVALNGGKVDEPLRLRSTELPIPGRHTITLVAFEQRRDPHPARSDCGRHGECGHA